MLQNPKMKKRNIRTLKQFSIISCSVETSLSKPPNMSLVHSNHVIVPNNYNKPTLQKLAATIYNNNHLSFSMKSHYIYATVEHLYITRYPNHHILSITLIPKICIAFSKTTLTYLHNINLALVISTSSVITLTLV